MIEEPSFFTKVAELVPCQLGEYPQKARVWPSNVAEYERLASSSSEVSTRFEIYVILLEPKQKIKVFYEEVDTILFFIL